MPLRPTKPAPIAITARRPTIPSAVLAEALDALCVRARWYERRCYETPPETLRAIRYIAGLLDVDATKIGPKS